MTSLEGFASRASVRLRREYFCRYSLMVRGTRTVRVRRDERVMLSPITIRMGPFLAQVRVLRRQVSCATRPWYVW